MKKKEKILSVILYIVIFVCTGILIPFMLDTIYPNCFSKYYLMCILIVQSLGFAIPVLIGLQKTKILDYDKGEKYSCFQLIRNIKNKLIIKEILLAIFLGICLFYFYEYLCNIFYIVIGVQGMGEVEVGISLIHFLSQIIVFAIICVILEEIFYRGILLEAFYNKGKKIPLLLVLLAFAVAHSGMERILSALFLGIVLILVVIKTGSLKMSMFIHGTYNVMSIFHANVLKIPFSYTCLNDSSNIYNKIGVAIISIGIAIAFGMAGIVLTKKLILRQNCIEKEESEEQNKYFTVILIIAILSVWFIRNFILVS